MPKEKISFEAFVGTIPEDQQDFVIKLHHTLLDQECTFAIKEAKSGYVLSYTHEPTKRTVANYVFRKKGPMLRMYADHVSEYMQILTQWPQSMKATIEKAGPCKRLLSPDSCNSRCLMGFDFILDGTRQQKCRNNAFLFLLSDETTPYLMEMMEREMQARNSG